MLLRFQSYMPALISKSQRHIRHVFLKSINSLLSMYLQVVDLLNDVYTCFDSIIDNFEVYKVSVCSRSIYVKRVVTSNIIPVLIGQLILKSESARSYPASYGKLGEMGYKLDLRRSSTTNKMSHVMR